MRLGCSAGRVLSDARKGGKGRMGGKGRKRAMTRQMARFDQFEVDFRSRELRKGGVRVRLQDQPFQILTHAARARRRCRHA